MIGSLVEMKSEECDSLLANSSHFTLLLLLAMLALVLSVAFGFDGIHPKQSLNKLNSATGC